MTNKELHIKLRAHMRKFTDMYIDATYTRPQKPHHSIEKDKLKQLIITELEHEITQMAIKLCIPRNNIDRYKV